MDDATMAPPPPDNPTRSAKPAMTRRKETRDADLPVGPSVEPTMEDVTDALVLCQRRIAELTEALKPLAQLPEDPTKGEEDHLYTFARGGHSARLRVGDVRRARRLLGMP